MDVAVLSENSNGIKQKNPKKLNTDNNMVITRGEGE